MGALCPSWILQASFCKVVVKYLLQYGTVLKSHKNTAQVLGSVVLSPARTGLFSLEGGLCLWGHGTLQHSTAAAPWCVGGTLFCQVNTPLPGKYSSALHLSEKGMTSSGHVTSAQVAHMTQVAGSLSPGAGWEARFWGAG